MKLICLPIAAALAAFSAPVLAAPSGAEIAPVYTSHIDESGVLHLKGHDEATGKRFHFRVSKSGQVRGRVGGTDIAFKASDRDRDRAFREAELRQGS